MASCKASTLRIAFLFPGLSYWVMDACRRLQGMTEAQESHGDLAWLLSKLGPMYLIPQLNNLSLLNHLHFQQIKLSIQTLPIHVFNCKLQFVTCTLPWKLECWTRMLVVSKNYVKLMTYSFAEFFVSSRHFLLLGIFYHTLTRS